MTSPDPTPPTPVDNRVAAAEQALEASATPPTSRDNAFARGARREENKSEAKDSASATELAAQVTGELATEADTERIQAEAEVARLRAAAPGSPELADAEAALARIEADADAAVSASLDSGAAAADATAHDRRGRYDGPGNLADERRAEQDERAAGTALTDEEAARDRIAADRKGSGTA
jgi:hypothetical protein